jgi:hypothetical protein
VPRQGSARPVRQEPDDYLEDIDARPPRRTPAAPRYRPQQPQYRQAPADVYEDADYIEYDDRVIADERAYAPPPRERLPANAGRQRRPARAAEPAYEPDSYDDALDTAYDDYDAGFDDGFIDEDDWYEEEAAAGAYRPRQRAQRRQPRSIPRPNVTLPRPTMPRPTMPVAVKEAALVADRPALLMFAALCLSVLAMALVTMNRVDGLAPGFATHISASGIREDIRTEAALWRLPLMAGALLLMNAVLAWFLASHSRFSARFVLLGSMLVQGVIWIALIRIAF